MLIKVAAAWSVRETVGKRGRREAGRMREREVGRVEEEGWNGGSIEVINTLLQTGANYGQSNLCCKRERAREAEKISPSQAAR